MAGPLVNRRSVLRAGLVIAAGASTSALAGCTASTPVVSAIRSTSSASSESPSGRATPGGSRTLLAFFSRPGEQYWNGGRRTVRIGNTAVAASYIQDAIDVDTYRIEPAEPYPEAYEPTVQRNWSEVQADTRPRLAQLPPSLDGYDRVLLGSPVWALQEPMIMRTFVETVGGLQGVAVHPFVTYAVSGMGKVRDDYRQLYAGATITEGIAVKGEDVRDRDSRESVLSWLTRLGPN